MSDRTTSPATTTSQTGKPSMTMGSTGPGATMAIPHEKIAMRAYEKWCQRGCMHGTHHQDWLDAEAELKAEMMGGKGKQTMQQPAARPAQAAPAPMPQKSAQRR
jgi:Protein of unknown function (DUF2934)